MRAKPGGGAAFVEVLHLHPERWDRGPQIGPMTGPLSLEEDPLCSRKPGPTARRARFTGTCQTAQPKFSRAMLGMRLFLPCPHDPHNPHTCQRSLTTCRMIILMR
jgi:hypothetical protein